MIHKGKKNKSVYRKEEDEKYRISGFLGVYLFFAMFPKFPSHEKRIHENLTHTGIGK